MAINILNPGVGENPTGDPIETTANIPLLSTLFVRIVSIRTLDTTEGSGILYGNFYFYKEKSDWESSSNSKSWRDNKVNIKIPGNGICDGKIELPYNRTDHGVDIMGHMYSYLVSVLIQLFPQLADENGDPDWTLISIDLA